MFNHQKRYYSFYRYINYFRSIKPFETTNLTNNCFNKYLYDKNTIIDNINNKNFLIINNFNSKKEVVRLSAFLQVNKNKENHLYLNNPNINLLFNLNDKGLFKKSFIKKIFLNNIKICYYPLFSQLSDLNPDTKIQSIKINQNEIQLLKKKKDIIFKNKVLFQVQHMFHLNFIEQKEPLLDDAILDLPIFAKRYYQVTIEKIDSAEDIFNFSRTLIKNNMILDETYNSLPDDENDFYIHFWKYRINNISERCLLALCKKIKAVQPLLHLSYEPFNFVIIVNDFNEKKFEKYSNFLMKNY